MPNQSANEPIKIIKIVEDGVTQPPNDGTPGSALYAVPFQLSGAPSGEWVELFLHAWDMPPSFSSMHRPGIAHVYGNRIILDGTTIEEVERYHRKTLVLCVEEANKGEKVWLEKLAKQEELQRQQTEAHKAHVRDVASRIRFD